MGTLRMYLSLRVPTHPFSTLGLAARGKTRGNFQYVSTMVSQLHGVSQCGVCSGNQLGFLVLGANSGHTYPGPFCLQSRKISFP